MVDKAHAIGTTAIGGVLFTLAAVMECPQLAATSLASLSSNLFTNLADLGLRRGSEQLGRRSADINHHLQRALQDAFIQAIRNLRNDWPVFASNEKSEHLTTEANASFDDMLRDATDLLTGDLLDQIAGNAASLHAFQKGEAVALAVLDIEIEQYLGAVSEPILEYIQANLLEQFKSCFIAELKKDDAAHNKSWRAFQMLFLNSLFEETSEMRAEQRTEFDKLHTEIAKLQAQLERARPETRDPWAESTLTIVWADLCNAVTHEGRLTRREIKKAVRAEADRIIAAIREEPARQPLAKTPHAHVFHVPHNRNPHFIGRDELLAQIKTAFDQDRKTATLVQAIEGLGGVGKTQLAVEYAYRHEHEYDGVWWIRSEEPTTLASDYTALATRLTLVDSAVADQQVLIDAARTYLETTDDHWLLVFDNATEPATLRPYRPQRGRADVLITSRQRSFRTLGVPVNVNVLAPDDAAAFLLQRTGSTDHIAAADLATDLGYLPLALEQAAAFVSTTGESLASYLTLFRDNPIARLTDDAPDGEFDYASTVATTWEISFNAVAERSQAASDLLNLCAYLAPDAIPFDVLCRQAEHLPEPLRSSLSERSTAAKTLAIPLMFSLIERISDSDVSMHRLVQMIARNRSNDVSPRNQAMWLNTSVEVLNTSFDYKKYERSSLQECSRLLPHCLAAIDLLDRNELTADKEIQLLNRVGRFLRRQGQLQAANRILSRALEVAERTLPTDHEMFATTLGNLAGLLRKQGEFSVARSLYDRALNLKESAQGSDDPRVAITLSNLAGLLREEGDFTAARPLYERALEIKERAYGVDDHRVAVTLGNLAGLLREEGRPESALPLYERALAIRELAFGPDDPQVAITLGNLAGLLREQGEFSAARSHYERALAIKERAFCPDDPQVATTLRSLGILCLREGNLEDAQEYFNRAYRIFADQYDPSHPETKKTQNWLDGLPASQTT